jgi:hypothetical protein
MPNTQGSTNLHSAISKMVLLYMQKIRMTLITGFLSHAENFLLPVVFAL